MSIQQQKRKDRGTIMKLKYVAIVFTNICVASGFGYVAYEVHKRMNIEAVMATEAVQMRAEEIAAEIQFEQEQLADKAIQLECLATNIYYETMAKSLAGAMAVTDVVLNRVEHEKYPSTPCDVVHQSYLNDKGEPLLNKCQFSWYCDGKADEPQNADSWLLSQNYAKIIMDGKWRGITEGATHYHAPYVSPKWAKSFTAIGHIGEHLFFRMESK